MSVQLPKNVIQKLTAGDEPPQFKHNWLYSVLPIQEKYSDLYLSGYCRACDNAFSVKIPHSSEGIRLTKMGVPKLGCIDPSEI